MTNPFTDLLNIATHLLTKDLREKQKREEEEMAVLALKENLINFSLTCRCSGTAIPIGDTVNRYICLECGTRFVHAKHQFPSYYLSNELRNEIIILTKKLITHY